jgi:GDP-L-fucose synthase
MDVVGFDAGIVYARSKPDGTPRKLPYVSRMSALDWPAGTGCAGGIERPYPASPFNA